MAGRPKGSTNKKADKLDQILGLLTNINERVKVLEGGSSIIIDSMNDLSPKKDKPKRINMFDSMPEKDRCREDIEFDKKVWKNKQPTERRSPALLKSVQCMGCGKSATVNPATIPTPYRCNDCLTRGGR